MEKPHGYLLYTCEFEQGQDEERTLVIPKVQDSFRVYVNREEQKFIRQVGAATVNV